jgi:hypothetical protein
VSRLEGGTLRAARKPRRGSDKGASVNSISRHSANADYPPFAHNDENNVCVYDAGWAQQLHNLFIRDLDGCDRVTMEAWRRRGIFAKCAEVVASLAQDQI